MLVGESGGARSALVCLLTILDCLLVVKFVNGIESRSFCEVVMQIEYKIGRNDCPDSFNPDEATFQVVPSQTLH